MQQPEQQTPGSPLHRRGFRPGRSWSCQPPWGLCWPEERAHDKVRTSTSSRELHEEPHVPTTTSSSAIAPLPLCCWQGLLFWSFAFSSWSLSRQAVSSCFNTRVWFKFFHSKNFGYTSAKSAIGSIWIYFPPHIINYPGVTPRASLTAAPTLGSTSSFPSDDGLKPQISSFTLLHFLKK